MGEQQMPTRRDERQVPARPEDTNLPLAWLREIIRQARLAWRLLLDPRVPWVTKLVPPATLVYLISPIDIIPDLTLGLGQLDDLAVLLLGVKLFIELSPTDVVREHLRELGARLSEWPEEEPPVIEGEVIPDEKEGEEPTAPPSSPPA